jgi:hypothetical protein
VSKPPRFVSYTVADCSTLHITVEDNDLLGGAGEDHPQRVILFEYGYFVALWKWNGDDGCRDPMIEQKLKALGHSTAYIRICREAAKQGHKWLCIDRDGEDYAELKEFEW